jgi:hypothetical protein
MAWSGGLPHLGTVYFGMFPELCDLDGCNCSCACGKSVESDVENGGTEDGVIDIRRRDRIVFGHSLS